MFFAAANPDKQLLYSCYVQRVTAEELRRGLEDLKTLMAGLAPGFRLLVDMSHLESMDIDGTSEIGQLMELMDQSGVGMVVRLLPDPDKDIGLNILTVFHYPHHPHIATCKTMAEVIKALSL